MLRTWDDAKLVHTVFLCCIISFAFGWPAYYGLGILGKANLKLLDHGMRVLLSCKVAGMDSTSNC